MVVPGSIASGRFKDGRPDRDVQPPGEVENRRLRLDREPVWDQHLVEREIGFCTLERPGHMVHFGAGFSCHGALLAVE